MSTSFLLAALRSFLTILLFPIGWAALVAAITLINSPFKYMNGRCSDFSGCFTENLLSIIKSEKFKTEICIAFIIGTIAIFGRLLELWLQSKKNRF
jgi:hypothetical protein